MPIIDGRQMDEVQLTLCTDCALIYAGGYSLAEMGHEETDHRAGGESWGEYMERVESWEAVRYVTVDLEGIGDVAFTCTLCGDVTYGRMHPGTTYVIPG